MFTHHPFLSIKTIQVQRAQLPKAPIREARLMNLMKGKIQDKGNGVIQPQLDCIQLQIKPHCMSWARH